MRKAYKFYLIVLHAHRSLQKENDDPKNPLGPKACIPFETKNDKLWGCGKTKGLRLGEVICGIVNKKYIG